jgi:pimeloyl-ACP methyl ester carboxylesterase
VALQIAKGETMRNLLVAMKSLACLLIVVCSSAVYCAEILQRQFSVPRTAGAEMINGQIDWPSGVLEHWSGPVVVFVSAGIPLDRNSWGLLALNTVWSRRTPFDELSAALVREGVAVIRFDNPGVRKPGLKCRETILRRGIATNTVLQRCLDIAVVARFTAEKYQRSIENMLLHIERMLPKLRGKLVLFGFSEGLMHAAAVADRQQLQLSGLVAIGSPAERMESTTQWQVIDRMLELLPNFDANDDGIVSNDEIRDGYRKGVGSVMGMEGWLSPYGYWDRQNEGEFRLRMEEAYAMFRKDTNTGHEPGKLEWRRQGAGVLVPYVNDAYWNFHFHGKISPAEVMQRLRLPSLFMWGEDDTQVSVKRQVTLVDPAIEQGANIRYLRFPGRYHLLSKREDFDWMEASFMPAIAREVRTFLDQLPNTLSNSDGSGVFPEVGSFATKGEIHHARNLNAGNGCRHGWRPS